MNKIRFSKNTHKPDRLTMSSTAKRDDVSMPILKVSPGQDLETQLQKKVDEIYRKCSKTGPNINIIILIGAFSRINGVRRQGEAT